MADWTKLLVQNPGDFFAGMKDGGSKKKEAEKRRAKVAKGLEHAIGQSDRGEDSPRLGWFSTLENAKGEKWASFEIKTGRNQPVEIHGNYINGVPREHLSSVLRGILDDLKAGKLDAALEASEGGPPTTEPKRTRARSQRTPEQSAEHGRRVAEGRARAKAARLAAQAESQPA